MIGARLSVGGLRVIEGIRAGQRANQLQQIWDDADSPHDTQADAFLQSAFRAARSTRFDHRRAILSDVEALLRVEPGALNFMFAEPTRAANDTDPVIMPDYRDALQSSRLAAE